MLRQLLKRAPTSERTDIARLAGFAAPHWRSFTLALVLLIGSSMIGLALPGAIGWVVDVVFVTRDLQQLNLIALGLLGLFMLRSMISVIHGYLLTRIGQRIARQVRLTVYGHLQHLPLQFFATRRTGEIMSRLSSDVTIIQSTLSEVPLTMLSQLLTLLGGLALMMSLNWQLTLLAFVVVPPAVLSSRWFGRRFQSIAQDVQDRLARASVALEEMLSGIRVVKSFAREDYERQRFTREVDWAFSTVMHRARLTALFGPINDLFSFGAITMLLWFGGRQVVFGQLTPGQLIAFLFYALSIAGPLGQFASMYVRLREALGASKRVFEILELPIEPVSATGLLATPALRGDLRLTDVGFTYDGAGPTLHNINLDIRAGEVTALVGPSGAGKTTLVNLIPRFYDATAGQITIDDHDITTFDLRSLREQIGLVPQETFLFGSSIYDNIAYGRPSATEEEVVAAAQAANAHEFITALPNGYQTLVGEKGIKLSAGQRQRITIARMVLKNPRILILDEATSALDSESERVVQVALERLMVGRTTLVIAHRLSTIQHADRIVVLQNGRIVEQGRHAELLARSSLYQHLWTVQAGSMGQLAEPQQVA